MKRNSVPKNFWKSPLLFLAIGFGSGSAPYAPGTFGTLAAIPFYILISNLPLLTYLVILGLATIVSIWLCGAASKKLGVHDHPGIVLDEFIGFGVTMIASPKGWLWVFLGFVLFRSFDIWKPQPIKWLDKHVMGGFGVVIDDVIAGVYALLFLQLIAYFC